MKIESKNFDPVFTPKELKITFESKEEIEAFYAIFNTCPIADMIEIHTGSKECVTKIRNSLENNLDFLNGSKKAWNLIESLFNERITLRQ